MKLFGSYYLLYILPIWATVAILLALVFCIIWVGRDVLEGLSYNVSYASAIGDLALIIVVLIGATILQRGNATIPLLLQSVGIQCVLLLASGFLGVIVSYLTIKSREGQAMDFYHDVVVAPLFLYLAITLVPVIYINGTGTEKVSAVTFVLVWLVLLGLDVALKRMIQRKYLREHGVTLKK